MTHVIPRAGAAACPPAGIRRIPPATTRVIAGVWIGVLVLAWAGATGAARAAELVMFESAGCSWCKQWHADLGSIYPKTAESRMAPLRRVNLHDPWPTDLKAVRGVSFTPTFVLVHDGAEVGRITGYAGDEFFWFQLGSLLEKLPKILRESGS
ncbi:thioredoxin family protein [Roseospira visakhapatnamensis]|uniref:Thioredoxin family protein n=1 Tax=Roseospira visakhapatnamensis TaxID=390880 RepID=A0A7W6RBZ0_9PROT|nr:thioredoxin family protein [Roseospira visakhapatnamensis]MBB4265704.1 hypothetical protein [Roseospira visakhapatnamensis]